MSLLKNIHQDDDFIKVKNWMHTNGFGNDYIIHDDLTITLTLPTHLQASFLRNIPDFIKFRECMGDFRIINGYYEIIHDFGKCPRIIRGNFICNEYYDSICGFPEEVRGSVIMIKPAETDLLFVEKIIRNVCKVDKALFV